MFTNLIESELHVKEFKRRSSFFLITVAAYSVILLAAGIASVYDYDAQLEAQTSSLKLPQCVRPVERVTERERPAVQRPRAGSTNRAPNVPTRPVLYESPSNPR